MAHTVCFNTLQHEYRKKKKKYENRYFRKHIIKKLTRKSQKSNRNYAAYVNLIARVYTIDYKFT